MLNIFNLLEIKDINKWIFGHNKEKTGLIQLKKNILFFG
jgi:hypothetical protein